MIHDDEKRLYKALVNKLDNKMADAIGLDLGINVNRTTYILDKWSKYGLWNCGVSLRSGWLEPDNIRPKYIKWLEELIN